MKIKSPDFKNYERIPLECTCDGDGHSPQLEFLDVPEDAKSLVLIVDDPNAPGGSFVHWLIWNIAPNVTEIKKNSMPEGAIVGKNNSGANEYVGPCPPDSQHVYLFKLYALDIFLPFDANLTKKEIRAQMEGHILEKDTLHGFYERAGSENF